MTPSPVPPTLREILQDDWPALIVLPLVVLVLIGVMLL